MAIEITTDFESEISTIARQFRMNAMDEDACKKLKREASDLVDEIEDAIDDDDDYSSEEIREFKKLKKEASALEDYISAVGGIGNSIPKKADFLLANKRVRGSVSSVSKDKFCVDVILVSLGDYTVHLADNATQKNYTVSYQYTSSGGMGSGEGTMGLPRMSVRHICNNRDNPSRENITVENMSCKEF